MVDFRKLYSTTIQRDAGRMSAHGREQLFWLIDNVMLKDTVLYRNIKAIVINKQIDSAYAYHRADHFRSLIVGKGNNDG